MDKDIILDKGKKLSVFGRVVREKRLFRKMSQEQLADECGLDRTYIGGVERGERNISLINIHKIADALNISAKEFFEEAGK